MPLILNIETTTAICSVCISKDGELLSLKENHDGNSHAKHLTNLIQEAVKDCGITLSDLDAIAVSKGPGSYTGLRIGVSTAKGLCMSLGIPLIGVSTLQAIANKMIETHPNKEYLYCPILDARRSEVYYSLYNYAENQIVEDNSDVLENYIFDQYLKKMTIVIGGTGAEKTNDFYNNKNLIYAEVEMSSINMQTVSYQLFKDEKFEDTAYFEPFYLKQYVVKTKPKSKF